MYAVSVINKAPSETTVERPQSTEDGDKNHVQGCVKNPGKTNIDATTQANHDCLDNCNKSSGGIDSSNEQSSTFSGPNDHVNTSSNDFNETKRPTANIERQSDKIEEIKLSADDGTKDKSPMIRKSSTTTLSKFKEKRPEPLKLNPNLNQDLPLDLSVKSAGNVPPGFLSNIFNLVPMTTLETPRIQWQDNDALLALEKARSFSSSTNTSQRARISSLMGESPPMTPTTPLMDMLFSSSRVSLGNSKQPHSASMILESSSLNESTFESRKSQILDRWAHSIKPTNEKSRNDMKVGPRRSCSTDNLNFNACNDMQESKVDKYIRLKVMQEQVAQKAIGHNSKKNSISPLAIKSFSHMQNNSPTKFSYPNQHRAMDLNDTQQSPTSISNITNKSVTPTSVANATANLLNIHLNSPTGNPHSPITSMFDVGNLDQQSHVQQFKSTNFASFDHELISLDPLIPATSRQQHHQNSHTINHSSPPLTGEHNNNYQHIMMQHPLISSISSSNTLNTPTLISPSQLRAGHLCFQPSPTLSPMSSVFELPSPFLTFQSSLHSQTSPSKEESRQNSPTATTNMIDVNIEAKKSKNAREFEDSNSESHQTNFSGMIVDMNASKSHDISRASSDDPMDKITMDDPGKSSFSNNNVSTADDLSHLITSATCKVLQSPKTSINSVYPDNLDAKIDMDTECNSARAYPTNEDCSLEQELEDVSVRPVSVIPKILISDHRHDNASIRNQNLSNKRFGSQVLSDRPGDGYNMYENVNQRLQRNSSSKRSLSPKSFRVQVNNYRNQRFESSSAPPDVNQRQARAKIKTVTADSCFELTNKNNQNRYEQNKTSLEPYFHDQPFKKSCYSSCSQPIINQRNRKMVKLRQDILERSPSSTHVIQKSGQPYTCDCSTTLENRSCSAEPAIFPRIRSDEVRQCMSSAGNLENTSNCCQSTTQAFHGNGLSHSAQQLHYATNVDNSLSQDASNFYQPSHVKQNRQNSSIFEQNQQLPSYHNDMKYHYYTQQSISAGELHRATHVSPDRPSIVATNAVGNFPIQGSNQFQQQQPLPQHLFRPCQPFNQTTISSSLDSVDNLSNSYQSMQTAQKNQHTTGVVQANNQISVVNLLYGNGSRHMTNPQKVSPVRLQQHMDSSLDAKFSMNLHSSYHTDLESRSDSRSSCSMDFTNSYLGGGSRPNSAASSNLASKKYHCDQCSKSFTRSDMLTRHRRLHSGDRPFQCTECKQEFSRSDHLSTHMRTHTGEKPYKCKMCLYSACRKDMITRHLKVHSRGPHSADCL